MANSREREIVFNLLNNAPEQLLGHMVTKLMEGRTVFNEGCKALADVFVRMRVAQKFTPSTSVPRLTEILKLPRLMIHSAIEGESDPIPLAFCLLKEIEVHGVFVAVFEDDPNFPSSVFAQAKAPHTAIQVPTSSSIRRAGEAQATAFARAGRRWSGIR